MEKEIIPINELCLHFRDDILLRVFVMDQNRWDIWDKFCLLPANKKVLKYKYKLIEMKNLIKHKGQPEPVKVVNFGKINYPAMGAARISAIISLGLTDIEIVVCQINEVPKWNKDFTTSSEIFSGLPEDMMKDFKDWKEKYYEKIH